MHNIVAERSLARQIRLPSAAIECCEWFLVQFTKAFSHTRCICSALVLLLSQKVKKLTSERKRAAFSS
jgi:hypothetical protein